jgi:hypothetical protein
MLDNRMPGTLSMRHQVSQSVQGRLGVRAAGLEFKSAAAVGRKRKRPSLGAARRIMVRLRARTRQKPADKTGEPSSVETDPNSTNG